MPLNTYTFFGQHAVSVGVHGDGIAGAEVVRTVDADASRYLKIVLKDNRLLGIFGINAAFDPGVMWELILRRIDLGAGARALPARAAGGGARADVADLEIAHGAAPTSTIAFDADTLRRLQRLHDRLRAGEGADRTTCVDSRIQIVAGGGGFELALCRQCGDPKCVANCPAAALAKNDGTGVIDWDGTKCVNCLLCTVGCAYGGIVRNAARRPRRQVRPVRRRSGVRQGLRDRRAALRHDGAHLQRGGPARGPVRARTRRAARAATPSSSCATRCGASGPDTVLATPPGCIPGMGSVGYNGLTGTKVPVFHPLLTNTASMLAGVKRRYKRIGRDVNAVALAGDGGASDVGFQSLSGAAERGEQILFICVDNEGYMNTGMQRSSCTPYGAWTSTTPVGEHGHGKTQDAKNLPLIMMMHNCAYVATASTAFMEDLYAKLDRAIEASQARASPTCTSTRRARPAGAFRRRTTSRSRARRSRPTSCCCGSSIRPAACA